MNEPIKIGPMGMQTPALEPAHTELCKVIGGETASLFNGQYGFPQKRRDSLYEVVWTAKQQEWHPALSFIPLKKSYQSNVRVLERTYLEGWDEAIYNLYTAFTPHDNAVLVTGIEVGTILDFAVPRGLIITDSTSIRGPPFMATPLTNIGDEAAASKVNPLLALIQTEIDNHKWGMKSGSRLTTFIQELKSDGETPFVGRMPPKNFNVRFPKCLGIVPVGNQTLIVASTCGPASIEEKQRLDHGRVVRDVAISRGIVKFYIAPQSSVQFVYAFSAMRQASKIAGMAKHDGLVRSKPIAEMGHLPLFMFVESLRRQYQPETNEISLHEIFGTMKSPRVTELVNIFDGKQ